MSSEQPARSVAEELAAEQLAVESWKNRTTALVALRGEIDLLTVSKVAEVLDGMESWSWWTPPDDLVPPPVTR